LEELLPIAEEYYESKQSKIEAFFSQNEAERECAWEEWLQPGTKKRNPRKEKDTAEEAALNVLGPQKRKHDDVDPTQTLSHSEGPANKRTRREEKLAAIHEDDKELVEMLGDEDDGGNFAA
jgi:hypothetical protein